ARADGLHVEGGALADAKLRLDAYGRRGKGTVRRGRGADDEIDVDRIDSGADHSLPRRCDAEVRCQLTIRSYVAGPDAGALADPLIARIDHPGQVGVGEDALRQIRADTANDGTDDSQNVPLLSRPGPAGWALAAPRFRKISALVRHFQRYFSTTASSLPWNEIRSAVNRGRSSLSAMS